MLAAIPQWILIPLLMIAGAVLGELINWGIYAWTMILDRRISPWQTPLAEESPRVAFDKVPIIGWLGRRRDSGFYGKGFWIRPMLIEVVAMFGLPLFYFWQIGGGLTGGVAPSALIGETWFFAHTILLSLMCIATFIDFDEKMIPDQITIPGTIIALLFAALAPWFRLPTLTGLAANLIEPIHYNSPNDLATIHMDATGLFIALAIFAFWIFALMPKFTIWYVGFAKAIRYSVAHAIQPKRKTKCDLRIKNRKMPVLTKVLGVLFIAGMIAITLAWKLLPADNWESLFGSLLGLAIGGGFVWTIRIVGTYAMQQEAMGFGDVTLWAMVGAFLGWQAAMAGFFIAPFAALAFVVVTFITRKNNEIAFGPYLCFGATVTLFGWIAIWNRAAPGFFMWGHYLLYFFAGAMVLMVIMLVVLGWLKGGHGEVEEANDH